METVTDTIFDFHPISLDDQEWVREKLLEDDLRSCELTFANNFIWRHSYGVAVCQVLGCGLIRYLENGEHKYSFPFGNGDKKQVITLLRRECAASGKTLCMYPIEEGPCQKLKEWFPGQFLITSFRGDYDYIYTTEKLSTLKGSKLHGKRNHIARFMDEPDWCYEELTRDNMGECRRMAREWISLRSEKWNEEMDDEMHVLNEALDHFEELGLTGGVLRRKGEVVAFTVGEPLNSDTFVVHFEKAFPDLQGAYPMINQQFVLHACQDFTYVNREEDTGDLGLRKAKLSYYPDILLKKYNVSESHVVYATEADSDSIRDIWKTCFGDEDSYIDLYLNSRFEQENMLVIHMDGKPVSMASFLPVTITVQGEKKPARYVYAVATLPAYRDRGYAAEILRFAAEYYNEPLILQPAEENLQDYYRKLGFVNAFEKTAPTDAEKTGSEPTSPSDTENIPADTALTGRWMQTPVTPAEYKQIRDARLKQEGYVEWDENAIAYAIRENAFCGGHAVKLTPEYTGNDEPNPAVSEESSTAAMLSRHPFREEILLYRTEEETLFIMETTLPSHELDALLPSLLTQTGTCHVSLPQTGGMIRYPQDSREFSRWTQQTGYLGLTLG